MPTRRFVGRNTELATLNRHLDAVRKSGAGRMIAMRGRRQVGKSRLVEEFIRRSGAHAIFYTASHHNAEGELRNFSAQVASSGTAAAASAAAAGPLGSWEAALTLAATGASSERPVILVIDELPFLIATEPAIEAIIQKQWDRSLEAQPILLVLIGSDVSMMSALSEYGRPLFGRVHEMTVGPLSPRAIANMLDLDAAAALDAYLVIGGFPRLAQIWQAGESLWEFVGRALRNPESPLIVLGERSLSAEFPTELKARAALQAIGAGERVFTAIMTRAGVSGKTLETTLSTLTSKRVIERSLPYSSQSHPKLSRYHVADPYLRFWLRFIRPSITLLERGRGDLALRDIRRAWPSYAGHAIEPLVREAIELTLPDTRFGAAQFVGGFWNRDNSVEVDLVGGRGSTGSTHIDFVGSIKWRARGRFDRGDFGGLTRDLARVPGADDTTLLAGVSRNGFAVDGLDVALTPDDILAAFSA